ncbi:hypothetical protein SASPL_138039 [Salvia splendens]|uniref:Uncharacterized protein n=1 Tax=Salvia splendens TaxID=180675 RepID=A0A8X8WWC1_SALSN|nr:hypothetical protein SASPL_138039 [Salvia splendens]
MMLTDCTFMSLVWDEDRATGLNAKAPLDVVENLDKDQNVDQVDKESGEDGAPSITSPRDKGTSKRFERKRRSSDDLISSLERMANVFIAHFNKSNDQMDEILESFTRGDKERKDNRHKLNEKLQEIEVLIDSQRQRVAMKLVPDPDLLDYFYTLHDDEAKKVFLMELLK